MQDCIQYSIVEYVIHSGFISPSKKYRNSGFFIGLLLANVIILMH
ncbi:hypothetical protein PROSTU_01417 [Providencia stuartii ATCC 25827]|uniref:Uncharacterized protein n=1 Tax=Providencia stuartii ATCC 25827 TaxID=471874 RepID=A0AA86YN31_PROST|nr:hypothetical protein PROSTU_01417 [Providencia stuartii ATCC 25827]